MFCRLLKGKNHKVKYLSFSKCTDLPRNAGILDEVEVVKNYIINNNGTVTMLGFPNRRLHEHSWEIRERLEKEKDSYNPDMIVTHWQNDIHQDHKCVAEECLRVFRNKSILSYECIRSCPQFLSNYYVPITEKDIELKLKLLYLYKTQKSLYYNQESTLRSQAILRGAEIGENFAEGYFAVRIVREGLKCV